jgi:hypothetical protein
MKERTRGKGRREEEMKDRRERGRERGREGGREGVPRQLRSQSSQKAISLSVNVDRRQKIPFF